MKLTWYGHAAFRVEAAGMAIIMDPYNHPLAGGYLPIDEAADVVSISHHNAKYHSDTSAIAPGFTLVEGLDLLDGPRRIGEVTFSACRVFEDPQGNGPNAMVAVEAAGLRLVHMGDCGHPLDEAQAGFLRNADVLLAPAGGKPTIALPDLIDAIQAAAPRVVIPMHFKTPKINLPILPVEEFMGLAKRAGLPVERKSGSSVVLALEPRSAGTAVWVLEHAR